MRAVSTLLDVSLCLLLVTASVLTLVETPAVGESNPDAADETVEVLATTTARVTYADGDRDRTVHDTLAGLLAAAAVLDGRDGEARRPSTTNFTEVVTARVGRELRRPGAGVQVVAIWRPHRNSAVRGRVDAGEPPPAGVDVHAAAATVPAGLSDDRESAVVAVRPNRIGEFARVELTVRTWSR